MPYAMCFTSILPLQARMSKFNDSSSMWEQAKQEHDTSIDKVMKRDWMDNPARQGQRLSPRPAMPSQVSLAPACHLVCVEVLPEVIGSALLC